MAFCPNCGSPVEGRFCGKCGASLAGAAPPPAAAAAPPAVAGAGLSENAASGLCYIPFVGFIVAIIFLLIEPYNRNRTVRFHAFQSIFLHIALFLIRIALGMALAAIWSVSGFFFYWGFLSLVNLACLILFVYLAVMAFQRRMIVIPVLGPLARQQAGA